MKTNRGVPRYVGSGHKSDHHFDASAAGYASRPDYPAAFYEELSRRISTVGARRVLDLGCGDARVAEWAARLSLDVIGVDLSSCMLVEARRRLSAERGQRVQLVQGNAVALPIASRTMDVVMIGQAFHWMRRGPVAREVARILRFPGLWAVFWVQPAMPLSRSAQITDDLIAKTVPGYDAQAAHQLTTKSQIPAHFGFQVQEWITHFSQQYASEDYARMVANKSYVAANLTEARLANFRARLLERLQMEGLFPVVQEQYMLTAYFAEQSRHGSE